MCVCAAKKAVEGDIQAFCSCIGAGKAHGKNSVCSEICFVLGAVQLDKTAVDIICACSVHARDTAAYDCVDVLHSSLNALAAVPLSAVTKLQRLKLARAGSAGSTADANGSVRQQDFRLNSGISS